MGGPDREDEKPYYGPARRIAGVFLLVVAAAYVLLPSLTHERADPIILGIIAATGALLLGVEGANRLLGR